MKTQGLFGLRFAWYLISRGDWWYLPKMAFINVNKLWWEIVFFFRYGIPEDIRGSGFKVESEHPVATESLDHKFPAGTKNDNSTSKKFVMEMQERLNSWNHSVLDLGCSGGQMVRDFIGIGWHGVGIEGSDYSRLHGRANWPELDGINLFTCDITKPFTVTHHMVSGGRPYEFGLITMWDVIEHISERDLYTVFDNVIKHLKPGGIFVATTSEQSAKDNAGNELHVTRWSHDKWASWIGLRYPILEPYDLRMKDYHLVKCNNEPSYLFYRKND